MLSDERYPGAEWRTRRGVDRFGGPMRRLIGVHGVEPRPCRSEVAGVAHMLTRRRRGSRSSLLRSLRVCLASSLPNASAPRQAQVSTIRAGVPMVVVTNNQHIGRRPQFSPLLWASAVDAPVALRGGAPLARTVMTVATESLHQPVRRSRLYVAMPRSRCGRCRCRSRVGRVGGP